MSAPAYVNDGSFLYPVQNGPETYSYPFSDKGDFTSFIAKYRYRVAVESFRPRSRNYSINVAGHGRAYLCSMSDPEPVAGSGLVEWEETYASVPISRSEYGSISYTQQGLQQGGTTGNLIVEFNVTRDARFFYEYSLDRPLPRRFAPQLFEFGNVIYGRGAWGSFNDGQEILAQDTQSEIWMGRIYQRKSVLIVFQNLIELQ